MSQLQYSDADGFSSSIYDGDIDNLTFLPPENSHLLYTSELSVSQQTINSFDQEFLRPSAPLTIPLSLTRVGPDRRKGYVLYENMTHSDWVDWWLQTDLGKQSRIRWDSKHHSEVWSQFDQVANASDGAPKVMCKRCGQILEHPQSLCAGTTMRHGTSSMNKHLKGINCRNSTKNKTQISGITQFIQTAVSIKYLSFLLTTLILIFIEQKPFNRSEIYTGYMGTEASYFPYRCTASVSTSRAP